MNKYHENGFIILYSIIHVIAIIFYILGFVYIGYIGFGIVGLMIINHMKFTFKALQKNIEQ